jgi:hypothetical protein
VHSNLPFSRVWQCQSSHGRFGKIEWITTGNLLLCRLVLSYFAIGGEFMSKESDAHNRKIRSAERRQRLKWQIQELEEKIRTTSNKAKAPTSGKESLHETFENLKAIKK